MAQFITADNVYLHVPGSTRDEVLGFIADRAVESGIATDRDALLQALLAREQEGSCGMVSGFAIPHAKTQAVTRPAVMVVRTDTPVAWETMDKSDVTVAIALMVPDTDAGAPYLRLLAKLAVMLMDQSFVDEVLSQEDPAAVASAIDAGLDA